MKIGLIAGGFVLGAAFALVAGSALSQDVKPGSGAGKTAAPGQKPGEKPLDAHGHAHAHHEPSQAEMEAGMKAWMAAMTPSEAHKHLMKSVGAWDTVTKIWMAGPDMPPTELKGTTVIKSVLGDRFIMQEHKSQMPFPNEKGEMQMIPWDGVGLFGYDNYQKMYVGCWADTMGTQLLTMKGNLSPDGKTMTMYGEMDEPMLGVIGRYNKYVTHIVDDNTKKFEIYDLHAGENFKAVEVLYTRKK